MGLGYLLSVDAINVILTFSGNIGSTCGLVTGFSFVSVLEFIYFFTVKFLREVRMRQRLQDHGPNNVEPLTPNHFKPITRYRPIYWNELAGSMRLGRKTPG